MTEPPDTSPETLKDGVTSVVGSDATSGVQPDVGSDATSRKQTPESKDKADVLAAEVQVLRQELAEARGRAEQAMRESRAAHQAADSHAQRLNKRLIEREQELLEALPGLGLDENQVKALQQRRSQRDEMEALQGEAARAQAYDQQAFAVQFRNQYVADLCKDVGADPNDPRLDVSDPDKFSRSLCKNVGVDPDDPRLDKGDPNKFARSLLKIQREDAAKEKASPDKDKSAEEKKAAEAAKAQRTARSDLDVLSGPGGGAPETYDPYGDPNESLSKGLQKAFQKR